jgi:hypothetical protein
MQFIDEDETEETTREILGWTVERKDPYGFFFFVKQGKKPIPEELSGAFTTIFKVEDAIKTYEQKTKDKKIDAP